MIAQSRCCTKAASQGRGRARGELPVHPLSQGWVLDGRGFAPWNVSGPRIARRITVEEINTLTLNLWLCDLTQQGGVCRC